MITQDQINFYRQNGYVVLDDIFTSAELEECSREYDAAFERRKSDSSAFMDGTWKGDWNSKSNSTQTGNESTVVLSIHNVQNHAAIFTRMLLKDTLLDAVGALIGSQDILLHHTKAHVKPPGKGSPYPMHQDYPYFPYKKDSSVAIFIHLDDTSKENGGLAVYPGSHLLGPQEDVGGNSGYHYVDQDKFPIEKAVPIEAKKGQVMIFSYLLIHGSYPNLSDRTRRTLLIQMVSAHDEKLVDTHNSPGQGLVLRGRNPKSEAKHLLEVQGLLQQSS